VVVIRLLERLRERLRRGIWISVGGWCVGSFDDTPPWTM